MGPDPDATSPDDDPNGRPATTRRGGREHTYDADIQRMREDLPTLEAVERRRSQLWSVAGVLLLAASVAVFILIASPDAASLIPDSPALKVGFGAVSLAFLLYVFDQERRMRRLSEALVQEKVLSAALESRVRDLGTLSHVGHIVNSVLTLEEVLEIVLHGAFELTRAASGSVLLVEEDWLEVAVSTGTNAAPIGAQQPMGTGVAGWVATRKEPLLINGRLQEGQFPELQKRSREGGSSVCAPLLVADELVGILALERDASSPAFTDWEMRAVALFGAHAATAVSNARRYEHERANVERLADLIEQRAEYVATMVHDLKAPLTSVLGFARLMRQRADRLTTEMASEFAQRIGDSAQVMLDMVDGLLQGAAVEAQVDVRRDPVDLGTLLEDLAEVTAGMAEGRDEVAREVRVRTPDEPVVLRVDGGVLRSVLVNLLENAVKYSSPGSPIDLVLDADDEQVEIAVVDRGVGIPEEDREAIFERFRQRDGGPRTGVGLGLYIVRSLVTTMGGTVTVTSEVDKGSTFRVRLPRVGAVSGQPSIDRSASRVSPSSVTSTA